jgi:hypothetical protein
MNDVVITGYICAHWLVADFEYPAKTATDRDGPPLTGAAHQFAVMTGEEVRYHRWGRL